MPEIAVRMTKRNHNAFVHLLGALESQGFDLSELLITRDFREILQAKPKVVLYSFLTEEVWGGPLTEEVKLLKERGGLFSLPELPRNSDAQTYPQPARF